MEERKKMWMDELKWLDGWLDGWLDVLKGG